MASVSHEPIEAARQNHDGGLLLVGPSSFDGWSYLQWSYLQSPFNK